ncbi:MAG TPA: L-threonylcarbamoyladenylate synthase [Synechococcales cyanobacterium M55_K2018_004]|nr:L-threonylcarbamoyladenylate synthase [Synechococcales cyanobacterium M55_K2018_004]
MPQVSLAELIEAGRTGSHLISFPTDTVPALAARPAQSGLIYAAKQRSETKPLILMGGSPEDLWPYVQGSEAEFAVWRQVVEQYWPGALTLVLPASDRLPREMNPTDPTTIGIRVPNSAIARHILSQTGPLATTSVNRSGEPPLTTIAAINQHFPEVLTLSQEALAQLKNHLCPEGSDALSASGLPSTVAKWTGNHWKILRQGAIHL